MLDNKKSEFSFVAEMSGDTDKMMYAGFEGELPMIPLRDNVLFPGTVSPITVGRQSSVKTVKKLEAGDGMVAIMTQKVADKDHPLSGDIYQYGVAGKLIHLMKMPDGNYNALFQAFNRIKMVSTHETTSGYVGYFTNCADVQPAQDELLEYNEMLVMLKKRMQEFMQKVDNYPDELTQYIDSIKPSTYMMNIIAGYLPVNQGRKQELLACPTEMQRVVEIIKDVNNIIALADIKRRIERKTQSDLDQQQREYFLNQELKNIQSELGNKDDLSVHHEDQLKLRQQAVEKKWSKKVEDNFYKELSKLNRINPQSPDYNVQLTYLQTIVDLPWDKCTRDSMNLNAAEKTLNKDHYGMEKVKERILEHLAVLKMRNNLKSPIICLYGPPGVGKTSLGKSIASALKRKYVRISLGGVHDESEIRGHRRTYVGAMPGRIIKGMQKAGSANPVFILDEIDKVSTNNINGDPASALLEVLDPEQNVAFHDNYLDMDYDLSRVMFIATANDITTIPRALLDRMELIEVSGYITEEKIEIGKRHLVPKKKEENGLNKYTNIKVGKQALEFIIERYTRESGVRGLEKQIDKLFRKIALKVAKDELKEAYNITPAEAEELLGKPVFSRDVYQGNEFAGVVTGLAWTSVGGEILFIETSLSQGKAGKLTLTGNLGDVMKESAAIALEYIKAHADRIGIDMRIFDNYNLHIHVPEGAVPKDGPSAGVTMATSIASALTQRKVRNHLAMTGEITLRGKVLPVGGIKEKILAAKRAGITDIVICEENRKDIEEIPAMYLKGVTFHYVNTVMDVLNFALLDEKVADAIEFRFTEEEKKKEE